MTQTEFGKVLTVAPNYIGLLERDRKSPSDKLIDSLIKRLNVNDHWWETGDGEIFNKTGGAPPAPTNLAYYSANNVKEAALEYFKQCGIMPSVAEQVIEELAKLDKGHQLIEAGKIVNDVADILEEMDKKQK